MTLHLQNEMNIRMNTNSCKRAQAKKELKLNAYLTNTLPYIKGKISDWIGEFACNNLAWDD